MSENQNKDGFKHHRQILTDTIIEKMEKGTAPWQKPWPKGLKKERPLNFFSKKEYRGGNLLALSAAPFGDPRWMTFKQAGKKKWNVKPGEKGTYVEYINWMDLQKETDPETGEEKTVYVRREKPIISRYVVFNGEQIDGIAVYKNELTKDLPEKEIVESAQKLIEKSKASIVFDAPGEAFYDMENDVIHMTPKTSFKSTYDMYSAILHELAHWTSHPSRLDRQKAAMTDNADEYAREELRAELASYFMAFELGIGATQEHVNNHASFTKNWLDLLGKNRNEIYRAAKDAEVICSYLCSNFMDLSFRPEAQAIEHKIAEEVKEPASEPVKEASADKEKTAPDPGIQKAEEKPEKPGVCEIFGMDVFDPLSGETKEAVPAGGPREDISDCIFLDF